MAPVFSWVFVSPFTIVVLHDCVCDLSSGAWLMASSNDFISFVCDDIGLLY